MNLSSVSFAPAGFPSHLHLGGLPSAMYPSTVVPKMPMRVSGQEFETLILQEIDRVKNIRYNQGGMGYHQSPARPFGLMLPADAFPRSIQGTFFGLNSSCRPMAFDGLRLQGQFGENQKLSRSYPSSESEDDMRGQTMKRVRSIESDEESGGYQKVETPSNHNRRAKSNASFADTSSQWFVTSSELIERLTTEALGRMIGERRLIIRFENLGRPNKFLQTFGKSGAMIPNGLVGYHTVYQEKWKVEIEYSRLVNESTGLVCITWKVTNQQSFFQVTRKETWEEAKSRVFSGRTITNQVFRQALASRIRHLELQLANEDSKMKIANLQSMIKALRPIRFTQGLLVFGLQHRCVQEKLLTSVRNELKDAEKQVTLEAC